MVVILTVISQPKKYEIFEGYYTQFLIGLELKSGSKVPADRKVKNLISTFCPENMFIRVILDGKSDFST